MPTRRWQKQFLINHLDHTWRQDPMGLEIGGFGLYLTARETAKFGFLFLNQRAWDGRQILSSQWVAESTRDQVTKIYGRYSHGYHWWIARVGGTPCFLASGWGGQLNHSTATAWAMEQAIEALQKYKALHLMGQDA